MIAFVALTLAALAPQQKADPAAYALLEKAVMARSTMPTTFVGVEGQAEVDSNGKAYKLKFSFMKEGGAKVSGEGVPENVVSELQGQVSSIYGHRRSGSFADGDGRHPLTFTGEDGPLGKRIALNDSLKSYYRVRGDEITEVDRVMGGSRFIITIIENTRTGDGKVLPKHFTVNHFGDGGVLLSSEVFSDEYEQVDGIWMIKSRRVLSTDKATITSWKATFSGLKVTLK